MHEEFIWLDFIPVPHFVSYAFLASFILIGTALVLRGGMALVPRGVQNFVEVLAEAMLNLAQETIGEDWGRTFFPFIATLFMFILVSNFMGLIPGFISPTGNINMTAAMALPVFILYQAVGIKLHGFSYIKHFMGPVIFLAPLMLVVEVLSHMARPLTLSVRLFGNMFAKHMLLMVLGSIVFTKFFIPSGVLVLGVLVSFVQAFVFALLTTLYLAGAVEEAH
ncbi:MAG: F0F1 ATP synthase subunit A [Thermodesulfovibrionales bacterium]|nr:F0F1 ATP synthase subunit A [Thermodesulfovibrionales bacterium]